MNFGITFRNLKGSGKLLHYIDRRMSFVFAHTRKDIENATITLSDVNGPKGGVDKKCQIVIIPTGMKPIVVSDKQDNLRGAIDRCLFRASQCLHRKLRHKQMRLRKPTNLASIAS